MGIEFPSGFMWGTATAAHQVEGDNTNSDWWEWEHRPGTPVVEPSGSAIEHFTRYNDDIALVAELGFQMYRFSVEWARIEPDEGTFDPAALAHYRAMVESVRSHGMEPMVTLHHFTLPRWFAARGGFMAPDAPVLFERYCGRVVAAFGDRVDWYCTINEPGVLALGGYLGAFGWPPGTTDMDSWHLAINGLRSSHVAARAAVKDMRPEARVGATHAMTEYEANAAGRPLMEYLRRFTEDVFLEVCTDDDFAGVQTYTRAPIEAPAWTAPLIRVLVGVAPVRRSVLPRLIRSRTTDFAGLDQLGDIRRTDMGYECRPQAVAATVRRAAELLPGTDLIVTEHGIATANDVERIEFITEGLTALNQVIRDGIPLRGYLHWTAFDNFEWALGYRMQFGLIAVDRASQERRPKPSARFLGDVARTGVLGTN
jgi:beta-glucosidase